MEKKKIGLSSFESKMRLLKYGQNILQTKRKFSPLLMFIKKFNSPLLLILIIVSLISFFLGERTNAVIILLMVLFSAGLDFFNTYKSETAVEDLIARVRNTAAVWRNGKKQELPFNVLVPGDIVELIAGDIIPADSLVLEAKDFFVNQSALTGESFPAEKHLEKRGGMALVSIFEDPAQVFMGTSVVTGFATIEITKTGTATEFGRIAKQLLHQAPESEFVKGVRTFSYFIMQVTFVLVFLVFIFNFLLGRGLFGAFLFSISIAIGLTPELLPMIISIALSRGSLKMAKKDVIVKNLSSIENFGGMNILCTDKTGTLTEDRITLIKHIDVNEKEKEDIFSLCYVTSKFHTGVVGPLDEAIREHENLNITEYHKIDEIPFDFERKRDSLVVEKNQERILITKGAPESVMNVINYYLIDEKILPLDNFVREKILNLYNKLSGEGYRVLGVAKKNIADKRQVYDKDEETEMIFMGFAAFLDPPKESAAQAVKELNVLGVEVKILTGDSDLLTKKICTDLDIKIRGILTGKEILEMSDEELGRLATTTTIFARITPEQKERIILILKKNNQTVGFLGDGINDAPALKAADVGISVNNAVDVAKETADIILLRKSLRVLKDGVIEGRKTFQNTLKYIEMWLSSNFGNMLSMTGASLILPFLPMLPTQILLNNFLYDMSQLTLPMDKVDDDDVKKPPRWDLSFIKKYMLIIGPISSIFDFVTFGVLFFIFRLPEHVFQTGWFMESLATQVFVIYVIRTKKIPFLQSSPSRLVILNTILIIFVGWAIPSFWLGQYFGFGKLPVWAIMAIAAIVLIYLIMVEGIKRMFYKKFVKNY